MKLRVSIARFWKANLRRGQITYLLEQEILTFRRVCTKIAGLRGSVMVKALCCNPEGRGFDTR
jgi:hypothetical protein